MIEDDFRALSHEIRLLREAIQSLSRLLASTPHPTPTRDSLASPAPDSINERAAAEMIGMSVAVLRRWRAARQGPPFRKIGSAVRYSRTQVQEWLDSQPGLAPEGNAPPKPIQDRQPQRR